MTRVCGEVVCLVRVSVLMECDVWVRQLEKCVFVWGFALLCVLSGASPGAVRGCFAAAVAVLVVVAVVFVPAVVVVFVLAIVKHH